MNVPRKNPFKSSNNADSDEKYGKVYKRQRKMQSVVTLITLGAMCIGGSIMIIVQDRWRNTSTTLALQKEHGQQGSVRQGGDRINDQAIGHQLQTHAEKDEEYPREEASLVAQVQKLDAEVRRISLNVDIFEKDDVAQNAAKRLQEATRKLLAVRYGRLEPYRVRVDLEFQETIPDFQLNGPSGTLLFEMAPTKLIPHSVFTFMEIARQWKAGAFHRVASHVLQVMVKGGFDHLAFQEYSDSYPHKIGTVGYAGRPSGPQWYISTIDNTKNHGPGSQQIQNPYEADSIIGKVVEGFFDVVPRIKLMPGSGFVNDPKKHVLITKMTILVPQSGPDTVDGYAEWKPRRAGDGEQK